LIVVLAVVVDDVGFASNDSVDKPSSQGNAQPQGFGHIGFILDDLEVSCAQMEKLRPKHLLCFLGGNGHNGNKE